MRVQEVSGDVTELIGQTVLGRTSGATGIPVSTISIRENFTDIVEIEIDTDTQTGTFQAGKLLLVHQVLQTKTFLLQSIQLLLMQMFQMMMKVNIILLVRLLIFNLLVVQPQPQRLIL